MAVVQRVNFNEAYAGDVTPDAAWEALKKQPKALLVDVRTEAEWTFAGLPDLASINKETIPLSWKFYPNYELNKEFVAQLKALVPDTSTPLYFLCKRGGRSTDAAIALTEAGYTACYNVDGGFEGEYNEQRQRGRMNGWKASGLPWNQA